ncbi:MAG: glycogen debranching protein GlgX [Desulfobacterales bacterium]|nr:glycogen debranching protein GlgX [Desulfobacterales bacterium]
MKSGQSFPLGATVYPDGVNFNIYSKSATAVDLLLFDAVNDPRPSHVIPLDRQKNRTFHYWHAFLTGIKPGQIYAYRAHGTNAPPRGLRFDADKILLDPYGKGIAMPARYDRDAAANPGDNTPYAMKSVVVETGAYNWEGDVPLKRPFSGTIIYEMHVRGFTFHPSSGVEPEKRGTYAGLIDKIPYLQDLGITAVELLPIFQFDETEAPKGLSNYWGYNPVSFFTPHTGYSSQQDAVGPLNEFRDMVKALHRAGIEVILDVVYNHTAESDHEGPTFCFRGLENDAYYILEQDRVHYANYSGTGNTLNANHSVVRRLILDSLRYWVEVMHVDGFRFDLASILARDETGQPLASPPILWEIETDPILAGTKLIAEAWDAAGLYQVGTFIGDRWKEWNGRFRDDVRSFFKGNQGVAEKLRARFFASPDLYGHQEREPEQSINFVTCHDGFTLNDLVSYDHKHNEANGEDNRDGHDDNLSWNCGVEGPSEDPNIQRLRNRQVKNFFTIQLLALGTPMLLMGDEMRRTQQGNNNAYCQDNEINWLDWNLLKRHSGLHRFVRQMIRLRLSLDVFKEDHELSLNQLLLMAQIDWHGVKLNQPDWSDHSHSLSFTVQGREELFHIIFNAFWEALEFELPPPPDDPQAKWRRIIDTDLETPDDICSMAQAPAVDRRTYIVQPRSVVLLARDLKQ